MLTVELNIFTVVLTKVWSSSVVKVWIISSSRACIAIVLTKVLNSSSALVLTTVWISCSAIVLSKVSKSSSAVVLTKVSNQCSSVGGGGARGLEAPPVHSRAPAGAHTCPVIAARDQTVTKTFLKLFLRQNISWDACPPCHRCDQNFSWHFFVTSVQLHG